MPGVSCRRLRPLTIALFVALVLLPLHALGQNVNDRVLLVERALGIPGHPSPGNNAVSHRFPGGITVTITAIDAATGWFSVRDDADSAAWITLTYIASVVAGPSPTSSGQCYEVGLWNLEHFGKNKTRGFPEYTYNPKGPTYPLPPGHLHATYDAHGSLTTSHAKRSVATRHHLARPSTRGP